jgi:hypothetical protein
MYGITWQMHYFCYQLTKSGLNLFGEISVFSEGDIAGTFEVDAYR